MSIISIKERNIGVTFTQGKARVRFWSPLAESVALYLPSCDEELPMTRNEDGHWTIETRQLSPGEEYAFCLNKKKEMIPDPASLAQPNGVHGHSKAVDIRNFLLQQSHLAPALEDYIIYEIHTGTFSSKRSFEGIAEKLPHLKELGVTAIEIMPVAEFPGDRNWGYDGVCPFAVHHAYGGAEGLINLVNACHREGIAVILDVVMNHLGPEGNYLPLSGPYFTEKHHTPWGAAINFDDTHSEGVREFWTENILMWFRDFGIDAIRLDAVHAIVDFSEQHILAEISDKVAELAEWSGRKHYLIAECDLNDRKYVTPTSDGGYGMDAQWIDEFHHALRVTAGGSREGYYSDFHGVVDLVKSYNRGYVYDGVFSEHRNKMFGTDTEGIPRKRFVAFSQNHDQVGNRPFGDRSSTTFSFSMQKLMAGAVMISPFIPLFFMGEEYGETNPFYYFVSHGDPQLIEAVRKGRKREFADFYKDGEAIDPQSRETFEQSTLDFSKIEKGTHRVMLDFYKKLIHLRQTHSVWNKFSEENFEAHSLSEKKALVITSQFEGDSLIAILNFSAEAVSADNSLNEEKLFKLLHSADEEWGGNSEGPEEWPENRLEVPAETISIYSTVHD